MIVILLQIITIAAQVAHVDAFNQLHRIPFTQSTPSTSSITRSNTNNYESSDETLFAEIYTEDHLDSSSKTNTDDNLLNSLKSRKLNLSKGIGRRYITRTQKGFLNVHADPDSGPYAVNNIIGRLEEGQIIESIGIFEDWIQHDSGWSIAKFGGFVWLEPLDE